MNPASMLCRMPMLQIVWCEDVRKKHGEICPMHPGSPAVIRKPEVEVLDQNHEPWWKFWA